MLHIRGHYVVPSSYQQFTLCQLRLQMYISDSRINNLRAGNYCLLHPFSPVTKPCKGRDICCFTLCYSVTLDWTWSQDIISATMSTLQYRHGWHPRHGVMFRGPSSGGFIQLVVLSEPCQYIPCPRFPTKWCYVVIVHHNIQWKYSYIWHFEIMRDFCIIVIW